VAQAALIEPSRPARVAGERDRQVGGGTLGLSQVGAAADLPAAVGPRPWGVTGATRRLGCGAVAVNAYGAVDFGAQRIGVRTALGGDRLQCAGPAWD